MLQTLAWLSMADGGKHLHRQGSGVGPPNRSNQNFAAVGFDRVSARCLNESSVEIGFSRGG
jgi:hypothetical protein